ncbi:hypothetical protein Sjap_017632 [Stephania japonica]|uniref:Uncharacterized protein n=1 Tax=Stephania japonica TaxID=461633 RepID=A0AAP0I6J7_9MAGN
MGSCFSSDQYESSSSIGSIETAKVISVSGSLREYPNYVTVSQALEAEQPTSSSTTAFLCNSDNLYYDEFAQPLDSDEYLEVGQIYFVLPKARLQRRLAASDMAALAVKASAALSGALNKSGGKGLFGRNRKMKILPVLEVKERVGGEDELEKRYDEKMMAMRRSRSGSVKKLKRSASRRAKFVYSSFKVRLSTIHEGTVAN